MIKEAKSQRGTFIFIQSSQNMRKNCILFPKLFWPTKRKNCSSDQEKLLKFKAEEREFTNS